MLQEVMTSPGVIEFRDVPIPEIRDDQVLVKMMRLGTGDRHIVSLCGQIEDQM